MNCINVVFYTHLNYVGLVHWYQAFFVIKMTIFNYLLGIY